MKVKVKGRLSFPDLFEPTTFKGEGAPYYAAQFIVEAGGESDIAINEAITQVATEKWKDKAKAVLKGIHNNKQLCCYVDGDISGYDDNAVATKIDAAHLSPFQFANLSLREKWRHQHRVCIGRT